MPVPVPVNAAALVGCGGRLLLLLLLLLNNHETALPLLLLRTPGPGTVTPRSRCCPGMFRSLVSAAAAVLAVAGAAVDEPRAWSTTPAVSDADADADGCGEEHGDSSPVLP